LSDSPRRSLFYLQDNEDRLFWFVNYHIRNCSNPSLGEVSVLCDEDIPNSDPVVAMIASECLPQSTEEEAGPQHSTLGEVPALHNEDVVSTEPVGQDVTLPSMLGEEVFQTVLSETDSALPELLNARVETEIEPCQISQPRMFRIFSFVTRWSKSNTTLASSADVAFTKASMVSTLSTCSSFRSGASDAPTLMRAQSLGTLWFSSNSNCSGFSHWPETRNFCSFHSLLFEYLQARWMIDGFLRTVNSTVPSRQKPAR
jgi:hypothetical protein